MNWLAFCWRLSIPFLLYTILHWLSHWVLARNAQRQARIFSRLQPKERIDWSNRICSTVHALIACVACLWFVSTQPVGIHPSAWEEQLPAGSGEPFAGPAGSPFRALTTQHWFDWLWIQSMGYVLYDLCVGFVEPSIFPVSIVLHHIIMFWALAVEIQTQYQPFMASLLLLSELSTPFLNLRWFLHTYYRRGYFDPMQQQQQQLQLQHEQEPVPPVQQEPNSTARIASHRSAASSVQASTTSSTCTSPNGSRRRHMSHVPLTATEDSVQQLESPDSHSAVISMVGAPGAIPPAPSSATGLTPCSATVLIAPSDLLFFQQVYYYNGRLLWLSFFLARIAMLPFLYYIHLQSLRHLPPNYEAPWTIRIGFTCIGIIFGILNFAWFYVLTQRIRTGKAFQPHASEKAVHATGKLDRRHHGRKPKKDHLRSSDAHLDMVSEEEAQLMMSNDGLGEEQVELVELQRPSGRAAGIGYVAVPLHNQPALVRSSQAQEEQ